MVGITITFVEIRVLVRIYLVVPLDNFSEKNAKGYQRKLVRFKIKEIPCSYILLIV